MRVCRSVNEAIRTLCMLTITIPLINKRHTSNITLIITHSKFELSMETVRS